MSDPHGDDAEERPDPSAAAAAAGDPGAGRSPAPDDASLADATPADAAPDGTSPTWDPLAYDPVADDLDGYRTPLQRLVDRLRGWVALAIALGLVLPIGGVAIAEYLFGRDADRVLEGLGEDAALGDAMLLVATTGCGGRSSTGSAFAVQLPGGPVVVTNRHVVDEAARITVRPLSGGPAREVLEHRISTNADVAVLRVPPDAMPPALAVGRDAGVGDAVRVVGFPGGQPALSDGTVAALEGGLMRLDARIAGGSSGSPVLDDNGAVVGQVFARGADGRAVATSLSVLTAAARNATVAPGC